MQFGEIIAPSMKELFINRMEDLILSGELKAGDKLPSERELADEMKVSKTVVHEGIRELARCGFLDVVSRKGVTVNDYSTNGNIDTLIAIMNRNARKLDKHTACSLLDFRCYLECPALEILGAQHTTDDIVILHQWESKAQKIANNPQASDEDIANALYCYHRTILHLSGNTITPLVLNALTPAVVPFWTDYVQNYGIEKSLKKIILFTQLIEKGRGDEASRILREGVEIYKKSRGYLS